MSSDSEKHYSIEEEEEEATTNKIKFYKDDPEWSDLEPLPLPQQPDDPYYIIYDEYYIDLFGHFFAIVQKGEISPRCVKICEQIINNYPGTYTAWSTKYKCLEKLGFDYAREDKFLNDIFYTNPKSYQLWYYKGWLSKNAKEFHDQIPFLESVFKDDSKNFHAWNFALQYAEKWHQEKEVYELSKRMIDRDLRNNSAWNTRLTLGEKINVSLNEEFDDAEKSIRLVQKNEAAINFAFALVKKDNSLLERLKPLGDFMIEKNPQNRFAWSVRLFIETINNNPEEISHICDELIKLDPFRTNYYTLIKDGKVKFQ